METILGIVLIIVLTFLVIRDKDNDRKKNKKAYKKNQKTKSTSARSDEAQNKTNKEAKDDAEQLFTFGKSLEETEEFLKKFKKTFGNSISKSSDNESSAPPKTEPPEDDVLKLRGDGYELHVGRKFELKGDLVIYNGLIRGYEDQGVDVIVLSKSSQSIHLIQCKHWKRYEFTQAHLEKIYSKLCNYHPDYQRINPDQINHYLSVKKNNADILEAIQASEKFSQVRKTLYLSSSHVIQE